MYKVSAANQYLVRTGIGIRDIKLSKKGWVFPGQQCAFFDLTPVNYTLELHAMTSEKLEFMLPAVFTIGPQNEPAALEKYARLLSSKRKNMQDHVTELVKGVIEGETRVIAASMTMEEIFRERKAFKELVIKNVQGELDHFGLFIYNANVKSLMDTPGSEYFSFIRKKTQESAVNQAKIDVAEARYRGDVGERERSGRTRQEVSRVEAETVVYENERKAEIAKAAAELQSKQAKFDQQVKISKIEADQAAAQRQADLQKQLEEKRQLVETERLRADLVAKAKAEYEVTVQKSNAELFVQERKADADLFKQQQDAEALFIARSREADANVKIADAGLYAQQRKADGELFEKKQEAEALFVSRSREADASVKLADAELYAQQRQADAALFRKKQDAEGLFVSRTREADANYKAADAYLYTKQKEAEATYAMYKAQADGLREIVGAMGGNSQAALQYLMLEKGIYQQLAEKNAQAIQGLQPKITVWNTSSDPSASGQNPIADIYKSLPPLLSTIHEQTGLAPPSWLATVPSSSDTTALASTSK